MNIIHILGITILFGTSYSIEENRTQRTLLRKLQSYQPKESKPMWNEVLADVLVNKIKIFSFKKEDKQAESMKEQPTQENSALTNFISQVFYVYKKFVYDIFVTPKRSPVEAHLNPEIEDRSTDGILHDIAIVHNNGPKSEVELVEPKYHGKQILGNSTGNDSGENVICEGKVNEEGKCVNNSKLLLRIPLQCPIGYKPDRLGYCRAIF